MKAAIHSPYFDTLGGGERYVLSFAKVFLDNGINVDIESTDTNLLSAAKAKFDLNLSGANLVSDVKRGSGYDFCLWLSDGSVPSLLARKNFLHFQRPFFDVDGKSLISRMKFFRINKVIVNSNFTKNWIDKEFPVDSLVVYPPVAVDKFKSGKKENLIAYVGRFSQLEQAKRQDVLVTSFKRFFDAGFSDWKMVLAGGSEVGRTGYVEKLIEDSKGYPIKISENASFKEIVKLYAKAQIFWSAAGFGVDAGKEPAKVEHFGITMVEAMAAGVIPIVYGAGGPEEIIAEGRDGFLWTKKEQLVEYTKKLLQNKGEAMKISKSAKAKAQDYSYEVFAKQVSALL